MRQIALVCASCPESRHDSVTKICQAYKIQKAYGRSGDMVDTLSGKDWVGKWQSKVVMASVTLARTLSVNRVKLICLQGGRFCNEEYRHTQLLKAAVEREWKDGGNEGKILVDVHWTEFDAFVCDYPLPLPTPSKNAGTRVGGVEKAAPVASGKKQADGQSNKSSGEPAVSKKGKDATIAPKDSAKNWERESQQAVKKAPRGRKALSPTKSLLQTRRSLRLP